VMAEEPSPIATVTRPHDEDGSRSEPVQHCEHIGLHDRQPITYLARYLVRLAE
jgi:hypothetical protein